MDDFAGKLALLADGHERGAEPHRDDGPQEETPRIEANNDINLLRRRLRDRMRGETVHKVRDERLKPDGVAEEREDVQENDTLVKST